MRIDNYEKNNYKDFRMKDLATRLARLQRIAQSMDIPVLFIIDGWESSGRGYMIKKLTQEINPKYLDVEVIDSPTIQEQEYPLMHRFWIRTPRKGHVKVFDRSFYYELMQESDISEKKLKKRIESIRNIEKILSDDYTLIVKFFLDISKEIQKENIEKYLQSETKSFYVDIHDLEQNAKYEKYREHFSKILEHTDFEASKWNVIDATNRKTAAKQVLGIAIEEMEKAIERVSYKREKGVRIQRTYRSNKKPLEELDLSKEISQEEYDDMLKELQKKATKCIHQYHNRNVPIVLVFEGVDAAGKDGAIERLIHYADPRIVKVHAISAPDQTEKSHHYLWRFYQRFPKNGEMAIFSRSWYGRVMVERVEGFATDNEWERAYDEMLEMEKQLSDHGALVLKYLVVIDKEEQLKRFEARENEPDKQYKITEEDWRNREKWDVYIDAMNEMVERTDVSYAPWILVEGNDKKYARCKVIRSFIEYAEKHIKEMERK